MTKNNKLKDDIQVLSKIDKKVFEKICNQLIKIGWNPVTEYDSDWDWVILATKNETELGTVLRRIKPFAFNSVSDFDKAIKIQNRLRSYLVEVLPYKVFLGNKISLAETDKPFYFLSEADFPFWSKFFKSKKFSFKSNSIGEAKNLGHG